MDRIVAFAATRDGLYVLKGDFSLWFRRHAVDSKRSLWLPTAWSGQIGPSDSAYSPTNFEMLTAAVGHDNRPILYALSSTGRFWRGMPLTEAPEHIVWVGVPAP